MVLGGTGGVKIGTVFLKKLVSDLVAPDLGLEANDESDKKLSEGHGVADAGFN